MSTAPPSISQWFLYRSKTADTAREIRASSRNIAGTTWRVVPLSHRSISRQRDKETPCRAHTVGRTPYSCERQSERNLNKYIRKIGGYPPRTPAGKARIGFPVFSGRPATQGLSQSDSLALLQQEQRRQCWQRRQRHLGYKRMTVRPRRCRSTPGVTDASIH